MISQNFYDKFLYFSLSSPQQQLFVLIYCTKKLGNFSQNKNFFFSRSSLFLLIFQLHQAPESIYWFFNLRFFFLSLSPFRFTFKLVLRTFSFNDIARISMKNYNSESFLKEFLENIIATFCWMRLEPSAGRWKLNSRKISFAITLHFFSLNIFFSLLFSALFTFCSLSSLISSSFYD